MSTASSATVDTAAAGFSAELKAATQPVHDAAERAPFVGRLMGGEEPIESYIRFLAQLHAIYTELERIAATMSDDPVAGPFVEPALTRVPELDADLTALAGDDWRTTYPPTAATAALVDHLATTCAEWPGGFIAHHYVRYLGDLSGGQLIRRSVARTYGFESATGTRFFVFEHLDNGVQFKKHYRRLLDEAPWSAAERRRIVDEAIRAFELNTAVFESLS